MTTFGAVVSNSTLTQAIVIESNQFRLGVTAPTQETIGTTPTIDVLRFDAVGELASTFVMMPLDWDRSANVNVLLVCSLVNVELNADSLDWTLDYTVPIQLSTGSGVAKASTQVTFSQTVTTGNGLAIGDIYVPSVTLSAADATNPFTSSNAVGFALEIHLTNVVGVGAIHLLSACVGYESLY